MPFVVAVMVAMGKTKSVTRRQKRCPLELVHLATRCINAWIVPLGILEQDLEVICLFNNNSDGLECCVHHNRQPGKIFVKTPFRRLRHDKRCGNLSPTSVRPRKHHLEGHKSGLLFLSNGKLPLSSYHHTIASLLNGLVVEGP